MTVVLGILVTDPLGNFKTTDIKQTGLNGPATAQAKAEDPKPSTPFHTVSPVSKPITSKSESLTVNSVAPETTLSPEVQPEVAPPVEPTPPPCRQDIPSRQEVNDLLATVAPPGEERDQKKVTVQNWFDSICQHDNGVKVVGDLESYSNY